MKKFELNQIEAIKGNGFWGWNDGVAGACSGGKRVRVKHFSILWITVETSASIEDC